MTSSHPHLRPSGLAAAIAAALVLASGPGVAAAMPIYDTRSTDLVQPPAVAPPSAEAPDGDGTEPLAVIAIGAAAALAAGGAGFAAGRTHRGLRPMHDG